MEWPSVLNSPILSGPVCLGIIVKCSVFRLFRSEEAGFSLQPRLCGGESSLALTLLRRNSLLTGKNTGNFIYFASEMAPKLL